MNSPLEIGFGDATFTTPSISGCAIRNSTARTKSTSWIHETYCSVDPAAPPTANRTNRSNASNTSVVPVVTAIGRARPGLSRPRSRVPQPTAQHAPHSRTPPRRGERNRRKHNDLVGPTHENGALEAFPSARCRLSFRCGHLVCLSCIFR
jgi:hypothetical protein